MGVFLLLGTLVLIRVQPTNAQEPQGLFESKFFKPKVEIVSCDDPYARTRCIDGMCSTSTGSGSCSHHGGVLGPIVRTQPTAAPVEVAAEPPPTQPEVKPVEAIPESGGMLASNPTGGRALLGATLLVVIIAGAVDAILRQRGGV
ncbi:MAG: hypothetical protein FOGNACKC_02200 [Anaerolineae bacterium]|nr:hypothetical protein [Anaerolineae bacterium]